MQKKRKRRRHCRKCDYHKQRAAMIENRANEILKAWRSSLEAFHTSNTEIPCYAEYPLTFKNFWLDLGYKFSTGQLFFYHTEKIPQNNRFYAELAAKSK